jgi:isopentenyldiphosphate isomerase
MQEMFDIVDEENNIIGESTRKEAHKKGLIHKSVMFFVFNKKGQLLLNKRSITKEFNRGAYSIVLGGHVSKGQTYGEAVIREAKEEGGISSRPYYLGSFKNRFREEDKENTEVYYFIIDHEPVLDKSEIEFAKFVKLESLQTHLKEHTFIPETTILYEILIKNKENILKTLTKIP